MSQHVIYKVYVGPWVIKVIWATGLVNLVILVFGAPYVCLIIELYSVYILQEPAQSPHQEYTEIEKHFHNLKARYVLNFTLYGLLRPLMGYILHTCGIYRN